MSSHVSYKNKDLGKFTVDFKTYKTVFVATSLDTLITLFSLNSKDIVEVEGIRNMTFEEFKEKELKDVTAYYPCDNEFLLKNDKEKTIKEFTQNHKIGYEPKIS